MYDFCFNNSYLCGRSLFVIWLKNSECKCEKYADKYNDTWVSVIDNVISAWNNSSANISISKSSSSKNSIEAARYDDTWYGLSAD